MFCALECDCDRVLRAREVDFDMPVWPGGACPQCGEEMPPAMIRCRDCRTLLNTDLAPTEVAEPSFVPLKELTAMAEVEVAGYYLDCPKCRRELKIARKYLGLPVVCKHCDAPFQLDSKARFFAQAEVYSLCLHCTRSIRFNQKYVGQKVACRHCNGKLHIVSR